MLILAINPGSTSTKIAVYNGEAEVFTENIVHSAEDFKQFDIIYQQVPYRYQTLLDVLQKHDVQKNQLAGVVGRGGMFPPVKSGGYIVDETMKNMILSDSIPRHASNLGALLAAMVAEPLGIPAYIYDAVSVDEFPPIARITGMPEIERRSFCHVLNSKAVARWYAAEQGKRYEDMNFIVAHLGGGISVSAHKKGRIVDSLSDDNGPFSPERAGSVPLEQLLEICYSGKYTLEQMKRKIRGNGGLKAHLGTADCKEIENRIAAGDKKAELVYNAQIYQIAKGIALMSPALGRDLDAIVLTGGIAHSQYITDGVAKQIGYLGKVTVVAGEFEMEALALGCWRILKGEEVPHSLGEPITEG